MKKIYVFILSMVTCFLTTELQAQVIDNNPQGNRIKNGEDVLIENHPYQADLGGCGGTIIAPTWILTAEHCVGGIVGRTIGVGYTKRSDKSTGQTSVVKRVINFPCSGCDLSLLELETPLDLSGRYAKAIRYASPIVFTKGYVKKDMECYATGWGQLDPNTGATPDNLQGALLKFGTVQLSDERIRVEETEGRMVCRGDSGGPLVVYNSDKSERILVGAVSGGEGSPCSDYGFWGNVANAATWIEEQTGIKPYTESGNTDTEAPTEPTGLTAGNETQTSIDLNWTAATDNVGVTGYDIYQNDIMVATVADTRHQATGLTAGTSYSFKVKAKDAAGNESRFSNTATASTLPEDTTDTEAPTEPTELTTGNETQTTIDLNWTAATDNVGVTGYDIYQNDIMVATVADTRYQATGLTAGTSYSFKIKAKDAAGNESRFSNTATASTFPEDPTDTEAPTPPTTLTASNIGQTNLTLTWTASTDNVGITGYNVYQDAAMIGTSVTTSFNVSGLTAATTYQFTVKAMDAAGNTSENSNTATATTKNEDTTNICEGVPSWQWGVPYQPGDRVVYRGNLFEKLERGWKFIGRCTANSCTEADEWKSGTTYKSGDQVIYNGSLWERTDKGWVFVSSCGAKSSKVAPPHEFIAWPNPASNKINISIDTSEKTDYSIIDILGKVVAKGNNKSTIDISNLKPGTYLLNVTSVTSNKTIQFIKQ